jgi:hypothetical protein
MPPTLRQRPRLTATTLVPDHWPPSLTAAPEPDPTLLAFPEPGGGGRGAERRSLPPR